MVEVSNIQIQKLCFNNFSLRVYGYNPTTNELAVHGENFKFSFKFKTEDPTLIEIIHAKYIDYYHKIQLMTNRVIELFDKMPFKVIEYNDNNWIQR